MSRKKKKSRAKKSLRKKYSSGKRSYDTHANRSSPSNAKAGYTTSASETEIPSGLTVNLQSPQPGFLPKKPKLSVCMIVRDEEKVLTRCLKSVQPVADELIVVDTGSTDRTIFVAKDLGAKVFHFEWHDDFSAARNETLKHATGDWILQMDADEELLPDSIPYLKACISRSEVLFYVTRVDNGPSLEVPHFLYLVRLFRNHPKLRYNRPYHEAVYDSVKDLLQTEPRWQWQDEPNIIIRHDGYTSSNMREKSKRCLPIIKSYLNENPDDAYMLTSLGGVYYRLGHYVDAETCLKKALGIDPHNPETNLALGLVLHKQHKLKAASHYLKKSIAGDPRTAEPYVVLGGIYLERGRLGEAITELKTAVAIDPEVALGRQLLKQANRLLDIQISELKKTVDINSTKADMLNDLGLAYINRGMHDEAIAELEKAIAINPNLASAHMNLGIAYVNKNMLDKALIELRHALTIDPENPKAHQNLAIVHYKKGNYRDALRVCDRAKELGIEIHYQLLKLLAPYRQ